MGGSSKEQTIGYKYSVGIHLILGFAVGDKITKIKVDEKTIFLADSSLDGVPFVDIDEPEIFGGETREGGVSGRISFQYGKPSQGVNTYLQNTIGGLVPSFRGVISAILEQVYIGTNPYLKKWSFRTQRIHLTSQGKQQWYDAKSSLTIGDQEIDIFSESSTFEVLDNITDRNVLGSYIGPFADGDFLGTKFTVPIGPPLAQANTIWPIGTTLTLRSTFYVTKQFDKLILVGFVENGCRIYIDEELITDVNFTGERYQQGSPPSFLAKLDNLAIGAHEIIIDCTDEDPAFSSTYIGIRITRTPDTVEIMNPIHIIRECLTDPNWGMGYPEASIDNVSFVEAADTIYDVEKVGLCLFWDKQESIESFINKVRKHINAEVFVDKITGLWKIKLIRDDYTIESLPVLDPSNVITVTKFKRPGFGELVNSVTVTYNNVEIDNTASITVQDIALVQEEGATISTTIQYSGFPTPELASKAAQRDLQSLSTPLISCTIVTTDTSSNFNLGDVFVFTWPDYGVETVVMRVTNADYGDGKNNSVRLDCVQDVFTAPLINIMADPEVDWQQPSANPLPVETQLSFEVPYLEMVQTESQTGVDRLLLDNPEIGYVGVAALRPKGALNARLHTDSGGGFKEAGLIDFCPSATLSISIDRKEKTLTIEDLDEVNNITIGTWFQMGNELLSLESVVNNEITVKRGVLDTIPENHSAGAVLVFWDTFSEGDPTEYVLGETINVSLTPITPDGELSIEQAPITSVTMDQRAARPYPAADVELNSVNFKPYISNDLVVTWKSRNRLQQTSGILLDWFADSVTPEDGITYDVRIMDGVTEIDSVTGLSVLTTTFTGLTVGTYQLEIDVIRDGLINYYPFTHTFKFNIIEPPSIFSDESFGIASIANV